MEQYVHIVKQGVHLIYMDGGILFIIFNIMLVEGFDITGNILYSKTGSKSSNILTKSSSISSEDSQPDKVLSLTNFFDYWISKLFYFQALLKIPENEIVF